MLPVSLNYGYPLFDCNIVCDKSQIDPKNGVRTAEQVDLQAPT